VANIDFSTCRYKGHELGTMSPPKIDFNIVISSEDFSMQYQAIDLLTLQRSNLCPSTSHAFKLLHDLQMMLKVD
jgi:hypothetical protein